MKTMNDEKPCAGNEWCPTWGVRTENGLCVRCYDELSAAELAEFVELAEWVEDEE